MRGLKMKKNAFSDPEKRIPHWLRRLPVAALLALSACSTNRATAEDIGTAQATEGAVMAGTTEDSVAGGIEEDTVTAAPTALPEATATATPTEVPTPVAPREIPAIVREELGPQLINAYAGGADEEQINALIGQIAAEDADCAAVWEKVLAYWDTVNQEGFTNIYDGLAKVREDVSANGMDSKAFDGAALLPAELPQDDSLCFVVLGFQLNVDGTLRQEAIDRLITVIGCMQEYPNAYILLTGGPTASGNAAATEAGAMADWLTAHGIKKEQLIIENRSLITYDNAVYSYDILRDAYPQVQNLVIVSSAYHIPLGSILFEAQCLLYNSGSYDPHVIANVGCVTDLYYNFTVSDQAKQVKGLLKN